MGASAPRLKKYEEASSAGRVALAPHSRSYYCQCCCLLLRSPQSYCTPLGKNEQRAASVCGFEEQ